MKLGYLADGVWSHRAIEKIAADPKFEIAFIVPRYTTRDPVLRAWADKLEVPFLPLSNVNSPESLNALAEFDASLFVSMSFDQILKKDFLALAPRGVINCHAGALPFYRGRNILNWALINDAREFGITVHYVDEGIDTGDIILQRKEPISDLDTYETLLNRAAILCADTLHSALREIATGTQRRMPQSAIHPVGFYSGRRCEGDEWIDWNWTSRRIFNFVRAIGRPGPGARTLLDGKLVTVTSSLEISDAPTYVGIPGEVVGVKDSGIIVKTGDSTLLLTGLDGSGEMRMRIGKRFQSHRDFLLQESIARIFALEERIGQLEKKSLGIPS